MNELNLTPGRRESDWILNVPVTDASSGIVLKEAKDDYRYGITKLTITTTEDEKTVSIKDGSDDFIGPLKLGKYNPIYLDCGTTVYGTVGNPLILKTEEEFELYVLVQGKTGPPIPSKPFNPTPSDGAVEVSTDTDLSWESQFKSVNYNVYFGTDSDPELVSTQIENSYSPTLSSETTYYWRVEEYLNGNKVMGDLWTFTTS